ncbi:MAG: hypothetical protein DMG97_40460 [Acidobacteria bacterium]|nr:MAG: hypothetical protein DMG97_40460 [Acidobacteriota bacterium]
MWTSKNTYLEPDLFYVSAETESRLDPEHRTTADLVIEVTSPGSSIYDRNTKADTYAALGVKEIWLVDEVAERVEIRNQTEVGFGAGKLFDKGEQLESQVLSSIKTNVQQIFAD